MPLASENSASSPKLNWPKSLAFEQPTISRFEQGGDSTTLRIATQIAEALGVEVHELLLSNDRSTDEDLLISVFRTLSDDRRKGWMDMVRAAKDGS